MNKVRVIINKHVKCALTAKDILDGIATYTSPDLKMFDDLFTASEMTYYILPFDQENYTKYIEMMYKYSNTFTTFTPAFRENLDHIVNAIYPIGITKYTGGNTYNKSKPKFSGVGVFKKAKMAEMKTTNSGFEKVVE